MAIATTAASVVAEMATSTVWKSPIAGSRKNPAPTAPAAAPIVLAAYNAPAKRPIVWERVTNQRTAIGNVAPIASDGIVKRIRHETRRTLAKMTPGFPLSYEDLRRGASALNSEGRIRATMMTAASSA